MKSKMNFVILAKLDKKIKKQIMLFNFSVHYLKILLKKLRQKIIKYEKLRKLLANMLNTKQI